MSVMAKKQTSGEHKTPRQAVQFPVEWVKLARRLANKRGQPMLWYVLALIAAAAEADGLERPKLPWEDESTEDD